MTNPWFRLYSKIITDPKVEFLSFEDQRHFVWLLCLKNEGYLDEEFPSKNMRNRMIARKLGLQGEAFENAKQRLMEMELINKDWQPISWDSLQFKSDSSKERVRKYRERKKKSDVKRSSNVTVTAQDTDTEEDTDTEQERETRGRAYPPPDFEPQGLTRKKLESKFPDTDPERLIEHFKSIEFRIPKSWDDRFWSHAVESAHKFRRVPPGSSSPNREPLECRPEFRSLEEIANRILRSRLAGEPIHVSPDPQYELLSEFVDRALAIASSENPNNPETLAFSSLRQILLRKYDELTAAEAMV
ncbi:MAG: hypothetical protein NXH95_13580 [Pseudomonadaceae bacterium]|nr:hypothetical protein [Pseudomonadaceae bacterium]